MAAVLLENHSKFRLNIKRLDPHQNILFGMIAAKRVLTLIKKQE